MISELETAFINNQHLTVYSIEKYIKGIDALKGKCET
jgi:hypothetical protein